MSAPHICPFVSGLFPLAEYLQGSFTLCHVSEFHSFFRPNSTLLYIYLTCYSNNLSLHGHVGYFHLLPIENTAAVNMGVEVFVQDYTFILGEYSSSPYPWLDFSWI